MEERKNLRWRSESTISMRSTARAGEGKSSLNFDVWIQNQRRKQKNVESVIEKLNLDAVKSEFKSELKSRSILCSQQIPHFSKKKSCLSFVVAQLPNLWMEERLQVTDHKVECRVQQSDFRRYEKLLEAGLGALLPK